MIIDKGVMFRAGGVLYTAQEFPTNNGNFKAVDAEGRLRWFNTVTDKIYPDAGQLGARLNLLRYNFPFRICRSSEPQYEGVLTGVQELIDGDMIPIYRFAGGECCQNPFEQGITILAW